MNHANDAEQIRLWQENRDPAVLTGLMTRYQPVLHSVVNRYKTTGVSPSTLRARANAQLIKAFNSYTPTHGTVPTTHVWNSLQKVQRVATDSLMSGHVPEYRNLKRSTFTIVRDNMTDQLGREPSVDEMADELKWSQSEVGRMEKELGGEVTASNAEFDFYGNSTTGESRDKMLADYMYHELDNKDKVVFEHTFGYGGKEVLKNKDLAKRLGTNEMNIHRTKQRLADKIRSYR